MSLFRLKPMYSYQFGNIKVKIYHSSRKISDCYMTIDIPTTGEYHRIQANDAFYGTCLYCAHTGEDEHALKSAIDVYLTINSLLFASQANIDRFIETANSIASGLFVRAEENVAKVTPQENDEAEAELKDAIEYATMSKKERKRRKKELSEEINAMLNEPDNE